MDKGTALTLLGLNDSVEQEEIMERLDAEAFAVRDHFMRQPVIPTLFRSRVNRLVELSDVGRVLDVKPLGAPVDCPRAASGENFVLLVRNHVENIRRLRTAMAATLDPMSWCVLAIRCAICKCGTWSNSWRCRWTLQERPYTRRRCQRARKPIGSSSGIDWLFGKMGGNADCQERARMAQMLEREVS